MVQLGVVVEVVGSRHAAEPCEGAVGTCLGRSAVGQTFAVARRVVLGVKVGAVDTSAFEVGAAAEVQRMHCYPQSLEACATDDNLKNGASFRLDRSRYAVW